MPKERTPEDVYSDLATRGEYEEAHFDIEEVKKIKKLSIEDYKYGKKLVNMKNPNWRVIFNIHYDVLRELCSLLMRFEKQKISNHQGLFAFIILNFKELDLDWDFFETIRNIRNKNKYMGLNITKEKWKQISFQLNLYISTLKKEIEKRLDLV
ncbi:hypothetical protein JW949_01830 [Candidatus Woesearchaeota archaeon]|nr:hypothetical protein [Candidatus Woesearchaeota archaeon]